VTARTRSGRRCGAGQIRRGLDQGLRRPAATTWPPTDDCGAGELHDEDSRPRDEAHRLGRKVAAHAVAWDGVDAALRAGVNTIEHGDGLTPDLIDRMVKQPCTVPNDLRRRVVAQGRGGAWPKMIELERQAVRVALKRGMLPLISFGTDAGGTPGPRTRPKEFGYMVKYGMTPMQAIKSATSVAARLLDQRTARHRRAGPLRRSHRHQGDPLAESPSSSGQVRDEGRPCLPE